VSSRDIADLPPVWRLEASGNLVSCQDIWSQTCSDDKC
jgi:hypothetical protein